MMKVAYFVFILCLLLINVNCMQKIYTWGDDNPYYRAGHYNWSSEYLYAIEKTLDGDILGKIISQVCSTHSSAALLTKDNMLYTWGKESFIINGISTPDATLRYDGTGKPKITKIACTIFSISFLDDNGDMYCFGDANCGNGNTDITNIIYHTATSVEMIGGNTRTNHYSRSSGSVTSVYSTGSNSLFTFGTSGEISDYNSWNLINMTLVGLETSPLKEISGIDTATLLLFSNNVVYGWGYDQNKLFTGISNVGKPQKYPIKLDLIGHDIPNNHNIYFIAGDTAFFAFTQINDNSTNPVVWSWGVNSAHHLGRSITSNNWLNAMPIDTSNVPANDYIVDLVTSISACMILTNTGDVFAFGTNFVNALEKSSRSDENLIPTQILIGGSVVTNKNIGFVTTHYQSYIHFIIDNYEAWNCDNTIHTDSNVCHTHGNCYEENKCLCINGWMEPYCEFCDTSKNEWGGPDCLTKCYGKLENEGACSGANGVCLNNHTCECVNTNIWGGLECNETKCYGLTNAEGACSGDNGECVNNVCSCHNHWSGSTCSYCDSNWGGSNCDIKKCYGVVDYGGTLACNGNHGTCEDDFTCTCNNHWLQPYCSKCDDNWGGADCDIPKCNGVLSTDQNACNGTKGTCSHHNGENICTCVDDHLDPEKWCGVCNYQWGGDDCELPKCYGLLETEGACNYLGGECLMDHTCKCNLTLGWTGNKCDQVYVPINFAQILFNSALLIILLLILITFLSGVVIAIVLFVRLNKNKEFTKIEENGELVNNV